MENSDGRRKFAIAGVAGYIAPRHLGAIHALGHELTTAHDLSDSVGIMDRYFPGADFTTDWSSFERQLRRGAPITSRSALPTTCTCPTRWRGSPRART